MIKKVTLQLTFFLAFFSFALLGQNEPNKTHQVQKGETIYGISRLYNVSQEELIKANPAIKNGLRDGIKLIIPVRIIEETAEIDSSKYFFHEVKAKETVYALSKKYGIAIEDIQEANPSLVEGLKIGQVILLPKDLVSYKPYPTIPKEEVGFVVREVEPKETVYSICKLYGLSEKAFFVLNPHVEAEGLKVGMKIKLPVQQSIAIEQKLEPQEVPVKEKSNSGLLVPRSKSKKYDLYQLQEGDSIGNICARFSVEKEKLYELNPELLEGVIVGRYIVIPVADSLSEPTDSLLPVIPNLNVAMWLPFGVVGDDSVKVVPDRVRDMVVEFYSGFEIAMDSLASAGIEVNVKLEDTRNNPKKIESLVKGVNGDMDVIIGPVFKKNINQVMAAIKDTSIPVVSPLSKKVELENRRNLVGLVPSFKAEIEGISAYVNQHFKDANIIFVNPDKIENRAYVQEVRSMLSASETPHIFEGWVQENEEYPTREYFKNLLYPGKKNVFIALDNNPVFVTQITRSLATLKDTSIHLIGVSGILDIKTLDYSYLNSIHFTTTEPLFVNTQDEAVRDFIKKYEAINFVEPSKFAFLGYDLGMYIYEVKLNRGKPLNEVSLENGLINTIQLNRLNSKSGYQNQSVRILRMENFELKIVQ